MTLILNLRIKARSEWCLLFVLLVAWTGSQVVTHVVLAADIELAAGLEPLAAAQRMTVPEGFQVQLAAGEPMVHQPIAFTIDARGRLWVAEAYTYPVRAPEGAGRDKIIILEDSDGDGTLDNRKVFADGLNLVSGLEIGFGGVWVGAPPYLLFIPDRDGDDRPDAEPEVVLDGFGYEDTHETLNSFIWGPDGWLYGCHGVFTHSRVGQPGTPVEHRVPLNGGVWRFHPTRRQFQVFAWGTSNPWGVDFDDHGQAFATACVIPHLYHVVQGARYQRQAGRHFNPYVFDDIKTIADHAHYVGNIRDHAWWGHEPDIPQNTLRAGGGHAHCGAMIYLADNWPAEYRGQIFFNNVHGNRVNQDILVRSGSGFIGRHGEDLLLANDRWFRGINLKYGPDGSVYLIDWYDRNACHRRTPEIWDRTNGRIYRVSYRGGRQQEAPAQVDLTRLDPKELVALQTHPNDWYVRTARRLLQQRGTDPAVHPPLVDLLQTATTVPQRLRALWALHATGGLTNELAHKCLDDPEELVRGWAIQLRLEQEQSDDALLDRLVEMAKHDPSPVVRLYLASALQRLPVQQRWELAAGLVTRAADAEDHNLPWMYWYGVEPLVPADPERALRLALTAKIPLVKHFIFRRAAIDRDALPKLIALLAQDDDLLRGTILEQLLAGFEGRVGIEMPPAWKSVSESLLGSNDPLVQDRAEQVAVVLGDSRIFPRLRSSLANSRASIESRRRALQILLLGRDRQAGDALHVALADPQLRSAALKGLATVGHEGSASAILGHYASYNEAERRLAIGTLVTRTPYAMALLDEVEAGRVKSTDIHAYHIRQLVRFRNKALRERLRHVWGEIRAASADKQQLIQQYKTQLTLPVIANADSQNGRLLFQKTCASCHVLFGEGGKVGPDITGSNRADLDYLLANIIDPSAVLGRDYRMTVVVTTDGRVVSGLVQNETDSAVTIRTITDSLVLAKEDIDERELSNKSLMPDQLLDPLNVSDVADLIAYLRSPQQVALPAE